MFFKRFRKHQPTTDAEFVAAYQATGDLELLGALYERHMELVYAVCFKYLRDEEESKDAVMQLFEQLVIDLRRHEVQHFRSWLHSIARNYCLMQLRSRRVQVEESIMARQRPEYEADDDLPADALQVITDDDDALDLEHNLNRMDGCLSVLPPEQKRCIELFYLEQKSYADVADQTGYDLKQVKSYLQNGRRNLKICMEKHHD
ncbi:sigma-70 family RNA polymerase sigma factor [Nibrella saemangeumensis]|uniref:Sigma-70 family RNA polymerase sigma factor n=1 Tax=Nibrella saemangeumensis TaxID=1084526 RepID=A0ABP8MCD1_9BACT